MSKHEHNYSRRGIDNTGAYHKCECGELFYKVDVTEPQKSEANNLEWLDIILDEVARGARIDGFHAKDLLAYPNQSDRYMKPAKLAITAKINEMLEQSRTGWHKEVDGKCLAWNEKEQLWERLHKRKDEVLK